MANSDEVQQVVSATRDIAAAAGLIFEPIDSTRTRITHTYDWTRLTDENRVPRARATTAERLQSSLDRLAALAERH